jgi:hypothetical protein
VLIEACVKAENEEAEEAAEEEDAEDEEAEDEEEDKRISSLIRGAVSSINIFTIS